jgi:hypothetical protein
LGARQAIFVSSNSPGNDYVGLEFLANDKLTFNSNNGSVSEQFRLETNAVFRDPSAWYSIVIFFDTAQATASNRAAIYINGVLQTYSTATYMPQNYDGRVNTTNQHNLGTWLPAASFYLNGYMTEVNFIDGQALTPSSFGETDTNTGVWKPKAYSGTYGTNGFFLKFADNSGTTSTTLGKDSSGNGNNWTPNLFYVGPGTTPAEKAGIDSLVDSPTSYGTDTGVGGEVRGNYCTWNPLDNSLTLANGNLDTSRATASWASCRATVGMTSGKWYWEISGTGTYNSSNGPMIGISKASASLSTYPGGDANGWGYYSATGTKYTSATSSSYGSTWTGTDVIGVAFDADNGTLTFYKNNTNQGTAFTGLTSGPYFPAMGIYGTATVYCNFGQRPFAYTAPSGFKALCTQNLTYTHTIGATSTTQANDYFNTVLYTGNGSSQTVTGFGFNPDMVWHKGRSVAYNNSIVDAIRGNSNVIFTNTTDAEQNPGAQLDLATDGATVTYRAANLANNQSSATYVIWGWNAGGSNQTISVGQYATSPANVPSIASTVRANTTSGFSIVTYTGTGANATVGHGLGVAPKMVIVKRRDSAAGDWLVWNEVSFAANSANVLFLNTTNANFSGANNFNSTAPTSTVFSVGTNPATNASSGTHVAYCFAPVAGYSAFGSYTGNASTDGPFIYTGFRPRFVMWKNTTTAGYNWEIIDTARDTYNVMLNVLGPNSSAAESTFAGPPYLDAVSNGFKIRTGSASSGYQNINNNNDTYIYAAFAESPFKYSLAR